MAKVSNSTTKKRKHRSLLVKAKGYKLKRKNVFKRAKEALLKAGPYSYTHRRLKKRTNRRLWNTQINAAARLNNTTYSALINGLKKANIELDRKILSQIARKDMAAFIEIVKVSAK